MNLKRNKTAHWLRKRKRAVKGGLSKLVALAGETESRGDSEQTITPAQDQPSNNSGILRQDVAAFRLPQALAEAGEQEHRDWMPGGFVFFVVFLAILFIAIVAWHVSDMAAPR